MAQLTNDFALRPKGFFSPSGGLCQCLFILPAVCGGRGFDRYGRCFKVDRHGFNFWECFQGLADTRRAAVAFKVLDNNCFFHIEDKFIEMARV